MSESQAACGATSGDWGAAAQAGTFAGVEGANGVDAPTEPEHDDDMGRTDSRGRPGDPEPWREWFGGGGAKEILPRLLDGDRLEIWPRCVERLMSRGLMVDQERLYFRAVARIAYAGVQYRGSPEIGEFLRARIDAAIDDLVREEAEADATGQPIDPESVAPYRFLTEVLGIEPGLSRSAAVRFNVLDEEVRHTFFALVVEMRKFHRYVAEGNGPPDKLRAQLRTAFEAIGTPYEGWKGPGGES